jgi:putative DNA primase/helicase
MLRGARLVTATETEEGRQWAESRIKSLTGGDRVSARFMRQDFFEFTPQFKLFIAGNHRPGLRSVDEAIRRRFHLVPFAVTIPLRNATAN